LFWGGKKKTVGSLALTFLLWRRREGGKTRGGEKEKKKKETEASEKEGGGKKNQNPPDVLLKEKKEGNVTYLTSAVPQKKKKVSFIQKKKKRKGRKRKISRWPDRGEKKETTSIRSSSRIREKRKKSDREGKGEGGPNVSFVFEGAVEGGGRRRVTRLPGPQGKKKTPVHSKWGGPQVFP